MIDGQYPREFEKNFRRINEIIEKAKGDKDKEISLAKIYASKITDQYKAINRAKAARKLGHEHLFEVYFRRAYEIGAVSTQDYRDYVLEKLFETENE